MSNRFRPSRRRVLQGAIACIAAPAAGLLSLDTSGAAPLAPASPVAIGRCRRYEFTAVKSVLGELFDQIGGVRTLVRGKTISIKVNLTGGWNAPTYTLSPVLTTYTHPAVVLAACSLFVEYGASRIILCESLYSNEDPRLAYESHGYSVKLFESMIPNLLWEDTHNLGSGGSYRSLPVQGSPYLYGSFQFNHRYVDTDVMVSIPKMKNHLIAGVTLALKNMFGSTPSALYSSRQDDEKTTLARVEVLHLGGLSAAGAEILPVPSNDPGYRVPRAIIDINRARPVDLAIIDAVVTMHGGEGPWHNTRLGIAVPGLVIAGRNAVCTDAVAAAVMGYDPEAPAGSKPFYNGSNHLQLAADCDLGSIRTREMEILGMSIESARYAFQPTYRTNADY